MDGLVFIFIIGISLGIYFLPTIIAVRRDHPQTGPIVAVNLLLGWTFLGWVVAFVWSLMTSATYNPGTSEITSNPDYLKPRPAPEKVCPRCAETIKQAAIVCRFCGHEF